MGQVDWTFLTSGSGTIINDRQPNVSVPDNQLVSSDDCRVINGDRGHWLFRYSRETFLGGQDISIRAAISIKKTDNLVHSAGIGIHIDDSIYNTPPSENVLDRFSENGYQLMIYDDHSLNLHRIKNNTQVPLISTQLSGSISGHYKWHHIRLDYLLQSDGRAVLHVFTNNLGSHPITNPVWEQINFDIVENKTSIPQDLKVGFGGLIAPSESTYVDRIEILKS